MTAEEKAKELAQICFPDELNIWARENVEAKKVEMSCIAMYNWTVENVCKWLETNLHYGRRNGETLVNVGGLWANYANIDEHIDALKKNI